MSTRQQALNLIGDLLRDGLINKQTADKMRARWEK